MKERREGERERGEERERESDGYSLEPVSERKSTYWSFGASSGVVGGREPLG